MHERKMEMAKRSCAFMTLPGGFGTFEEVSALWFCYSFAGLNDVFRSVTRSHYMVPNRHP